MANQSFIDISKWQDNSKFNWDEVKKTQAFVIIKATEGTNFIDNSLDKHVNSCRRHNIPFGLYHFARPDRNGGSYQADAEAEAKDFCRQLKKYRDFTVKPVLDLEFEQTPLNRTELTDWCEIFAKTVKDEVGKDIIMYGNYYYLRDKLASQHELGRFPLWLAQYNNQSQPNRIPEQWKTWEMWQYSDKYESDMYPGPLDINWVRSRMLVCD